MFAVLALWLFLFPQLRRIRSLDEVPEVNVPAGARCRETMNQQAAATTGKGVQTVTVSGDEDGMRLDRFFEARFPGLSFSHIQRIIRKGEVRVNGKRARAQGPHPEGPGDPHAAAQDRAAEAAR